MLDESTLEIDKTLVSREFLANPYPVLHQLRERDPVHWSDTIGGWVLTRYDDIVSTFKEPASYSNEGRLARAVEYLPAESRGRLQVFEDHYRTKGLLHSDPPDHTRLRRLVTKAFTPRMIEALRPRIQAIVDELLDEGMRQGGMDIIPGFAVALPITVLAEILGTPVADRVLFKRWADDLLAFQGVNKPAESTLLRSQETILEMKAYLTSLIRERKGRPGEDLISQLVLAESEGDKLSEAELLNTCITLLVAGHETTTSLIGNGVYLLLSNTFEWNKLKKDKALLTSAIEEILRYESPVSRQPRLMKHDTELSGRQIRKGQMVFQMLNAANRDPAYFTNPDAFDIERKNNRHIAFGVGIHFCVGAVLSRTEGQIVFGTLLERAPEMRLMNEEPAWDVHKANSRMLTTLPVVF
jgi:pimeloyl-[acyl-carrier protein] synthase